MSFNDLILGDSLELLIDNRGKNPPYEMSGVPVVSGMSIRPGGDLDLSESKSASFDTWKQWMPNPTKAGDVIMTSEAPLGRVAAVRSNEPILIAQRVFGMRGRAGILDSRFLFYALQTVAVQSDLASRATGSTVLGIRQPELRKVLIPAPSYDQQIAIAGVLGALDDKVAANTQCIDIADKLACALFRECCDITGMALHSAAAVTMGSSPPGSSYNESGSGVPFYQGVRDFGLRSPTRRVWTDSPVRTAEEGDTLLSVRAPVGRANLAREHICLGRGLAGLRSRSGRPMTLFHQVRAAEDAWAPFDAEGTVFGSINRTNLESVIIPTVRSGLDGELEAQLAAAEANIAAVVDENDGLVRTRDELLPLLMSGVVTIKAAQEFVEGLA